MAGPDIFWPACNFWDIYYISRVSMREISYHGQKRFQNATYICKAMTPVLDGLQLHLSSALAADKHNPNTA